ncbi:hypothetical protein VCRA2119O147_330033 [Vibrio crassostreae]|jgi:DNA polymerase V|uniref:DUF4113 domain-containing protein n=2 Tax=Vibrio TaxID=662 RepID=A0ABM9QXS3_9VIBR|nr:DUF4113 domain-containing protein [Vibrio crassostreae]APB62019.1 hypothetical protein [Vibrio crassostreae]ROO50355.1 uncharacterized protein DUF4113 [Vibrio crassostreae]TCL18850.1 uncharacterized protein DUF4113 [Vibrio crassostreae]TCN91576.1 uncharacterized protein DUF4113 [Vibrio crassostreae]TCN96096.1 uncharacterized protein DUF4113 [Vibrio crassostreae]
MGLCLIQRQIDLFSEPNNLALMQTLDALNTKFGRSAIFFGARGTTQKWQMNRNSLWDQYLRRLEVYDKKFEKY